LFQGELIQGPATAQYEIPPLPEGTYPFKCDVHPQMTGSVTVAAGGREGGGGEDEGGGEDDGGGAEPTPTESPPDDGGG
jgi:hypothetical protein